MTDEPWRAGTDADLLAAVARALCGVNGTIAVAVSGGGDSVALLHLLYRLGAPLHAVTVDHGLRAEAAQEAADVATLCARLGIAHEILRWHRPAGQGNLMDQARRARLSLMAEWARGLGIGHVMLGHTADDQAETFLMNLSRKAGVEGLSGMRPSWMEQGIRWSRPLLAIRRARLRDYLQAQGVAWSDDPSNDNPRFLRVRARQALAALGPLGIGVEQILHTMGHLVVADQALAALTARAAGNIEERAGALTLSRDWLLSEPPEIRRRLFIGMIRWMGGAAYPPRAAEVARLEAAMAHQRTATLGGVSFRLAGPEIAVVREASALSAPVEPGNIWDNRWLVDGPPGVRIAALGVAGLRQLPDWRATGLCRDIALATPAAWAGDRLISAPLLGTTGGYSATLTPSFVSFLLSH